LLYHALIFIALVDAPNHLRAAFAARRNDALAVGYGLGFAAGHAKKLCGFIQNIFLKNCCDSLLARPLPSTAVLGITPIALATTLPDGRVLFR